MTSDNLEWHINKDHWRAKTDHGCYTVGDSGNDTAHVLLTNGVSIKVSPFDMGREVCDWNHYLTCMTASDTTEL